LTVLRGNGNVNPIGIEAHAVELITVAVSVASGGTRGEQNQLAPSSQHHARWCVESSQVNE